MKQKISIRTYLKHFILLLLLQVWKKRKEDGPYQTYEGSPISKGEFQHNLWGIKDEELSGRWDWAKLRKEVKKHGVRNSLLVAPMPTASTSQILGNNECFEPYTSNIYTRRVLSGEFIVVNKHLLEDLVELGLWNDGLKARNHESQWLCTKYRCYPSRH